MTFSKGTVRDKHEKGSFPYSNALCRYSK